MAFPHHYGQILDQHHSKVSPEKNIRDFHSLNGFFVPKWTRRIAHLESDEENLKYYFFLFSSSVSFDKQVKNENLTDR